MRNTLAIPLLVALVVGGGAFAVEPRPARESGGGILSTRPEFRPRFLEELNTHGPGILGSEFARLRDMQVALARDLELERHSGSPEEIRAARQRIEQLLVTYASPLNRFIAARGALFHSLAGELRSRAALPEPERVSLQQDLERAFGMRGMQGLEATLLAQRNAIAGATGVPESALTAFIQHHARSTAGAEPGVSFGHAEALQTLHSTAADVEALVAGRALTRAALHEGRFVLETVDPLSPALRETVRGLFETLVRTHDAEGMEQLRDFLRHPGPSRSAALAGLNVLQRHYTERHTQLTRERTAALEAARARDPREAALMEEQIMREAAEHALTRVREEREREMRGLPDAERRERMSVLDRMLALLRCRCFLPSARTSPACHRSGSGGGGPTHTVSGPGGRTPVRIE